MAADLESVWRESFRVGGVILIAMGIASLVAAADRKNEAPLGTPTAAREI